VNFTAYPQEIFEMKESEGVEVVMYIFEGDVRLFHYTSWLWWRRRLMYR